MSAPYLTPLRFGTTRTGFNLSKLSPIELNSILTDATAVVDSYCTQPLSPTPATFLGSVVVDEEHPWRFSSEFAAPQRRIYPYCFPVKSVEGIKIVVGHQASVQMPVDSIVINNAGRWIEITSLTIVNTSGLFGVTGWIVPVGGLIIPVSKTSYTYGWELPEVDERCYAIDSTNKVFQTAHGHWTDAPVVVKVDGIVASPDPVLDRLEGRVTFATAQTGMVTVSYAHKLPSEISIATGLIARSLLGDASLAERGMEGLQSLRVNEISATRFEPKIMRGGITGDNLELTVPRAALMLTGFKHWRAA